MPVVFPICFAGIRSDLALFSQVDPGLHINTGTELDVQKMDRPPALNRNAGCDPNLFCQRGVGSGFIKIHSVQVDPG